MKNSFRDWFSYDSDMIYFNNAATGMIPQRVINAMKDFIDEIARNGKPPFEKLLEMQSDFRAEAAKLLNVEEGEVAFVRNTTDGLEMALHSIDWNEGDNMIVQEDAFPASLYLAHYCFPDVEKRYIPLISRNDFYKQLEERIDDRTRAVVVDLVHFLSGRRFDLKKLGEIVRKSNAYLIVDGIQAAGAMRIDLSETPVDFFTAGGVKWLLSPSGTGIFYVRKEILGELVPFHISWAGAHYDDISSLYPVRQLHPDARRFQPANENYIGMVALTESLRMFNELGTENTEKRVLHLTAEMMSVLQDLDFEIFTPKNDQQRAGIVTFRHPSVSSSQVFEALTTEKVVCSLREGWVRFSLHFYNGEDEIEKAVSILKNIVRK